MFNTVYTPFIDGEPIEVDSNDNMGAERVAIRNPADNSTIAHLEQSTTEIVDEAVQSARAATEPWRETDPSERGRLLVELADAIEAERDRLAALETAQTGKPRHETDFDVTATANFFRYFGGIADKVEGAQIPVPGDKLSLTIREPLGVTGHIIPWNSPLLLAARSFGPALACGNTVVALPDQQTPITTLELAALATNVGVPSGVISILTGDGAVGSELTGHDDVDSITFTGSVETGTNVLEACAQSVTPSVVELGSKSPVIIMEDGDIDAAVESVITAGYLNAGQQCFAASRVLVEQSVHDAVVDRLVDGVCSLVVGPSTDEDVTTGPLISPSQLERVESYVALGEQEGASILVGGERPADPALEDGNFFLPTVFDDVDPGSRIAQEEIFGPVVSVITADGYEELIDIANGTPYGLTAGIWTDSVRTAHRAIRDLEAGVVSVNAYPATFAQTPFGGYKQSGIGREKRFASIAHYTQVKNATIDFT